jgi:hypothetical protein
MTKAQAARSESLPGLDSSQKKKYVTAGSDSSRRRGGSELGQWVRRSDAVGAG